jgi:hypothetical protein
LRPTWERIRPAVCCVDPFESGSWHAEQPCVFQRDRRTSLKSCSPRATFLGSNAGACGTGVMGSSTRAAGVLTSRVEPEPGARYPGTNNEAAAAYAHNDREEFNEGWPLVRFDSHGKPVADAAFRLDDPGCAGIGFELAPQSQHLDVDTSIKDIFVHPGRLQKLLPRQGPLW